MNLAERDRRHLWHPYTQEKNADLPIPIVAGSGVWLETAAGEKILDAISSWWVNIHGHAHPYLNEALARQAEKIEHTMFAGLTHEPAVKLAEKLIEVLPADFNRVFYSDNGSTAVEVALKMAYQYWQNSGQKRTKFVALAHSYHGDTFGAMAASDASAFTKPFAPLLFEVLRAASPYSYECGQCAEKCTLRCTSSLAEILEQNQGEIAAVIIEPMLQGAGGMIVWESDYLAEVSRLCKKYDVLLIADEVLTGFGRTGRMFASEYGAAPDIICLSKALTAGYLALGATVATEKIYEAFLSDDRGKTFFHGHSFTANPLACAVAVASLELFESENRLEAVRSLGKIFTKRAANLRDIDRVGEVRTIGGVLAIELKTDSTGYLSTVGRQLYREFLSRKILLRPLGNILYFMPPYVITENETDWVLDQIEEVIKEID